ncbi:DNA-binding XRE family transcriptional regulator [Halospina denitrificans]|uniref:DNA-binding XRE family transcriptional regulator n=1 Tax=Halospina denitrificans TaxID=332522 RepID=A0A4R7JIH2_9GAMM|nr:helix-turn-helix transcriptional regulator [Halospina denitrificans]TDT37702.1 DNA-binding XRE family transcriptional regulator [Halospina denitrificans]
MTAVGTMLAEYRRMRRLSQMELGLEAEVSARHISFIETGRTEPSREMLMRLAAVLELPQRECNLLLNAGGHPPAYSRLSLDDERLKPVSQALDVMLDNHNPYPALVMDSHWNILRANQAQEIIMGMLLPASYRTRSRLNVMELIFDPEGLRPFIQNWDELASLFLRRMHSEVMAFPTEESRALFARLLASDPPKDWQQPPTDAIEAPMITADLLVFGQQLRIFSTLSRFGTALDVNMADLLIEYYFPADETTRQFLQQLTPSHVFKHAD